MGAKVRWWWWWWSEFFCGCDGCEKLDGVAVSAAPRVLFDDSVAPLVLVVVLAPGLASDWNRTLQWLL